MSSHLVSAMRRSRPWRRLAAAAMLGTLALLPVASASPALAAAGDPSRVLGADLRDCPDVRCGSYGWIASGTQVPTYCWRDAGSDAGTNRWFRVSALGHVGWVSLGRVSPQATVPYCNDLATGETLWAGQDIWSTNGAYKLSMQTDGNLVSYGPGGALWSSRTAGSSAQRVVMQGDGNLVLYTANNTPVWFTGTSWGNTRLVVQDDSNVVEYTGSSPLWATSWHRQLGATRTWNAGVAGNCTWYANERFRAFTGTYPALSGDAGVWDTSAQSTGWMVLPAPATQSIVVFDPNVQGSGSVGHVAWVDYVQPRADGTYIHVWEMNFRGLNVVSDRWVKHVPGMSYIMARQL